MPTGSSPDITCYVAEADGRVAGMYKLIPNRPDLGSHVSNASFMVHPDAAGRGIGSVMGRHSLEEARRQGYEAMQFNFVVSTNERAVSLWQRLGFHIVGTLPNAFRHGTRGMVDALVMYRRLDDIVLVFGKERGAATRVRHCAYAVLSGESADGRSCVALVRAREDILLPGGGLDPGEDHRAAVIREIAEECAIRARVTPSLGDAVQIVGGRDGRPVVEKRNRFFSGTIDGTLAREPEHEVLWLSVDEARRTTTNESHRWALTRWQRLNT